MPDQVTKESKLFIAKMPTLLVSAHTAALSTLPPASGHANSDNVIEVPFGEYFQGGTYSKIKRRAHILIGVCSFGGTALTTVDVQPVTNRKTGVVDGVTLDTDADTWTEDGDSLQTVGPLTATATPGLRNKIRVRTDGSRYLGVRFANQVGGDGTSTVTIHWYVVHADLGDIT